MIEGISRICEKEDEISQCKELILELTRSLLLFVEKCTGEIRVKASSIQLESVDNGKLEKVLCSYKTVQKLFTEKDLENEEVGKCVTKFMKEIYQVVDKINKQIFLELGELENQKEEKAEEEEGRKDREDIVKRKLPKY